MTRAVRVIGLTPETAKVTMTRQLAIVLLLTVAIANPASAQFGGLKKIKDAAKKAAAAADSAKSKNPAETPPQASAAAKTPAAGAAEGAPPAGAKVWENYDFVPGNRVIFFTDFSEDKVGNFARGLKYKGGSLDVVERDGVKMLRAASRGAEFQVPVRGKLPQRFTLEFDVIAPTTYLQGQDVFVFEGGSTLDRGANSAEISWNTDGTLIQGGGQTSMTSSVKVPDAFYKGLLGQVAHIRVLMDSAYFKLYVNERRMYNIPELGFKRDSLIRVVMRGSEDPDMAMYVTRVRVAESETDVLYDALAAKGRWATQGILFATGKAEVQPESRPVLKEIAATLKEHGDLKVLIEGHTDNVGSAASNLKLSDDRAAAVKKALVSDFGIAGDRITTRGMGDTKPATPNTTAEGRAQNRRVEVVKQ
jgi:outer membrane protein OmpA-like peptidoglycan-associated protein